MKLKIFAWVTYAIWLNPAFTAAADPSPRIVSNPVTDYIQKHNDDLRSQDQKNEHVIRFEIDVDNDGRLDVFLSSEKSSLLTKEYENAVRSWDLYKSVGNGNYAVIDQQKTTDGQQTYCSFGGFDFDPKKIYVGTISEIGGFGMLAIYYVSRHNQAQISAYIVGSNYFENKNFPNPAGPIGIYHRDDADNIPDLPDTYKHYFATPPTQTVTILPQTF